MANSVKICAVALDFDGVIANLDINWNDVIKKVSKIASKDIKSLLTFYETTFGTPIHRKISAEIEEIELQALKKTRATPFVCDFLRSLCEKKMPTYIVSMQTRKVIDIFLNQNRLCNYITEIMDRENFPNKRSQVEYVTKIIDGRVLFVDDLKRNLSSCGGLNVECFYFPRNQKKSDAEKSWNKILERIN